MQIKPFAAVFPKLECIASPDEFCSEAKNAFLDYQRQGWLAKTGQKALYIYQVEGGHRRHTGLVALNDVQDFFSGKVKKHEKTLSEREQRQMDLLLRWGAVLKPVLLTYPAVPDINAWLAEYTAAHAPFLEVHFNSDGQTHRIWMAPEESAIREVQELFSRHVARVYIADGHHRTTTLAKLHQQLKHEHRDLDFDYLFCAFFATDQLDILDYNRVVEQLNGYSPNQLLDRLSEICTIEPVENPRKPRRKHEIKMLLQDKWYRLVWKAGVLATAAASPAFQSDSHVLLDVGLLNELVLHNLLGIQDVRTDARIIYVEGSKGLKGIRKAVRAGTGRVGFALHPVTFQDMMRMADADESLPPKSTYFEPRLKSGMLIRMLSNDERITSRF